MKTDAELKAMISLLDDDDAEISTLIEDEIKQIGESVIPMLERHWENENTIIQRRIEELIHAMQYEKVLERLHHWHNYHSDNLLEGLWSIASYLYPDLSLETLEYELEQLFIDAWVEFRDDMNPIDQIKTLNHVFYSKIKFEPNIDSFHSPNNSMINLVLESRRGNPIGLCCIYMLIAKRLKMPIFGVNLPNLFVLKYQSDKVQFYINVFNKGLVFMKSDIDHYIMQLGLKPHETFYNACTNHDIIRRVLRNLTVAYEKLNEPEKVKEIYRMSLIVKEGLG